MTYFNIDFLFFLKQMYFLCKKNIIVKNIIIFALALFCSCSVTRHITPLEKGEHDLSFSFGGPLIKFSGLIIPVPLTAINYGYGYTDRLSLSSGFHTTSLMFGVFHFDFNAPYSLYKGDKFGITTKPGFHFMADKFEKNISFYPFLETIPYYIYNEKGNMFFGTASFMFDTRSQKAFNIKNTNRIVPYISIGHIFKSTNINYTIEMKYLNFSASNKDLVTEYISPSNYGALGLFFGISKTF